MTLINNVPQDFTTRSGKFFSVELEANLESGATVEVATDTGRVRWIFSSSAEIADNERTILATSGVTTLTLKDATVTVGVTITDLV